MAVTLIGGPIRRRREGFAQDTYTQSTATTAQALNLFTDLSLLGLGTATGFTLNIYSLASGIEGQTKYVLATATGEAKVQMQGATATGLWVLSRADDWLAATYFGGAWRITANGATLATST